MRLATALTPLALVAPSRATKIGETQQAMTLELTLEQLADMSRLAGLTPENDS